MATDPQNPTPAAAPEQAPEKTADATPETKAKAARTTARKPRARRAATASRSTPVRRRAARPTPGATAARPTLGRPAARPAAPEPVAAAAPGTATFGGALLDAVEATGDRVAGYHEQLAEATPLPWFANVARANAELTRVVTRAYVLSGRKLLRG
jgi:hypothetical protein